MHFLAFILLLHLIFVHNGQIINNVWFRLGLYLLWSGWYLF